VGVGVQDDHLAQVRAGDKVRPTRSANSRERDRRRGRHHTLDQSAFD
jgi:hypothetical protein